MPVAAVIAIAAQVCDGLAAAHAGGVIHRDIKPANLIVTPAGVVKICDFGIARGPFVTADTSLTGPMFAMGTSKYMAPEQAQSGPIDARADLYALGCTMYAMLAGSAPFSGEAIEVIQQHLNKAPLPLREHRDDIPPPLEALVTQLLAKAPSARPDDAADVKARLVPLLPDQTTTAILIADGASSAGGIPAAPEPIALPRTAAAPPDGAASSAKAVGSTRAPTTRAWRRTVVGVLGALAAILTLVVSIALSLPGGVANPGAGSAALLGTGTAPAATTAQPRSQSLVQPSTVGGLSQSAQPSSMVSPSSQAPPVDPIVAMRLSIQRQVDTGNLNPDKASDLYKRVDDISRAINDAHVDEAAKNIKAMRDRLASLHDEGQLSLAGYDSLIRDLDSVAIVVA